MDELEGVQKNKTHRKPRAGRKAEKKKEKTENDNKQELTPKQRNPKAFAIQNPVKAEREFRRFVSVQMS